ncbi:C2 calcium-dependent domain-containing protein 4C [Gadus macrocephalus]|uniref:C2 calcium-dependent domain-containing protein 4C n=1 Tax=Gadus macrocephalus TaxID=80720 RepID=UPI0028CB447F|nr:C2 calcium-dependent domain-containing protein 4C [Gadus macrocephalus]
MGWLTSDAVLHNKSSSVDRGFLHHPNPDSGPQHPTWTKNIPKMWLMDKIRDRVESLPQELAHLVAKADACLSPKTTLSKNLNNNILTPDKIPEFCLPPKLFRRKSLAWNPEGPPEYCFPSGALLQKTKKTSQDTTHDEESFRDACLGGTATAKTRRVRPPPFSAEGYGLAGMYESPNTRRKESLFHGKCPGYVFDRSQRCAMQVANRTQQAQRKTLSLPGLLPLFLGKRLSETGSTESETSSSSSDSTPIGSPYSTGSSLHVSVERAGDPVSEAASSSSCHLVVNTNTRAHRWRPRNEHATGLHRGLTSAPAAAAVTSGPGARLLTLVPPTVLPVDTLQCQKPLQHEHSIPLLGGGCVRLSTERIPLPLSSSTSSSSTSGTFTVRVRVVSVEGLMRDDADQRPLSCALSLCLVPGKLQLQKSATIRNCSHPVFNEDFFFTELSEETLSVLELRLKVMDRSASGTLRRGAVRAVVLRPLSQLLPSEVQ